MDMVIPSYATPDESDYVDRCGGKPLSHLNSGSGAFGVPNFLRDFRADLLGRVSACFDHVLSVIGLSSPVNVVRVNATLMTFVAGVKGQMVFGRRFRNLLYKPPRY